MRQSAWEDNKERSNKFTLNLICWIALNLPRIFARSLLYPITLYFLLTSPKVRFSSRKYLERISNNRVGILQIAKHIFSFSATVLDRIYFLTGKNDNFEVKVVGLELIDKIIKNKTGCILLGSHIGSFDALQYLSDKYGYKEIKTMMHLEHNSMITEMLNNLNPKIAKSIINTTDENALLKVKESIDKGIPVGMLGDRIFAKEKSIKHKLLGDSIKIPTMAFVLADVLKTPLITFFGVYLGANKYIIHFEEISADTENNRENLVKKTSNMYVKNIEKIIKQHPYNWFNFYDYWNDSK